MLHGEVLAQLFLSSSALDTDVTAKLVDVYPSGENMLLVDGAVRMRGRGGLYSARFSAPLQAGAVYAVNVSLGWFSYLVTPGHALRLDVASSNWPRFSVNRNNGLPLARQNESEAVVAENAVHHDAAQQRASALLLPLFELSQLVEV